MELSHSQTTNKPSRPKVMDFFPLQKLKGTQPTRTLAMGVVCLGVGAKSRNPDGIKGMVEEFVVCLAGVVGGQRDGGRATIAVVQIISSTGVCSWGHLDWLPI